MKLFSKQFNYKYLENISFESHGLDHNETCILICLSGYETRSRFFIESISEPNIFYNHYFLFNYQELKTKLAREDNDSLFKSYFPKIHEYSINDEKKILMDIVGYIKQIRLSNQKRITIDIDISSMPRYIYCSLPLELGPCLAENDTVRIFYSIGKYNLDKFPTIGTSEFKLFSGQLSLLPVNRTHLIGLSFDAMRTEGIINFFDPRYLVTYYTIPAATKEYEDKILFNNSDIINKSDISFQLSFFDFEDSLSKLIAICKDIIESSDICIIPDGPKNIILLASLIPNILCRRGIVCFHVSPNRSKRIPPIDTLPNGKILGFKLIK